MTRNALILAAGSALALAACSKKAPEQLPPQPTPTPTATTPVATGDPNAPRPGSQAHYQRAMQGQDTIYFDTDRYNIDNQDQAALRSQAQYFMAYPQARITVEGHADERGTRDYNLALGERRANAAKNFLVTLGVDAGRISTISYGKERPVAVGSDAQAWARNRRAVSVVIN